MYPLRIEPQRRILQLDHCCLTPIYLPLANRRRYLSECLLRSISTGLAQSASPLSHYASKPPRLQGKGAGGMGAKPLE